MTHGFLIDLAGSVVRKTAPGSDPIEAVATLVAQMIGVKVPAMGRLPEWEELCAAIYEAAGSPYGDPVVRSVGRHRQGAPLPDRTAEILSESG
jgi:hypothetical protein